MNETRAETGMFNWPVYSYFAAVLVFSGPFWLVGFVADWEPLPRLPVSSLMVIVPGIVAFALVARADGRLRATTWLKRALVLPGPRRGLWVVAAVFMPPAILFVSYLGMQIVGCELPEAETNVIGFITLLALFFLPAAFEELGWSCFALAALQQRMSALRASILIGSVWAVWHIVPLLQAGRAVDWIVWWGIATVALRVLITWIFNSTSRTILAAALFHASENAGWQSFPVRGSHYDPAVHAIVLWIVCAAVVASFGWKTLARTPQSND